MTEHLCRACLSEDTLTSLFSKWTNDGTTTTTTTTVPDETSNLTYFDCFNLCTNLMPKKNGSSITPTQRPARICSRCLRELRASYLFWSKCHRSEEELLNRLETLNCDSTAAAAADDDEAFIEQEEVEEEEQEQGDEFKTDDEFVAPDNIVPIELCENTEDSGKILIEVLDVQEEDEEENVIFTDDVIYTAAVNEYEIKELNAIDDEVGGGDPSSSSIVVEQQDEPQQQLMHRAAATESVEYETCYLEVEDGAAGGNEECGEWYQCDYCAQGFG